MADAKSERNWRKAGQSFYVDSTTCVMVEVDESE